MNRHTVRLVDTTLRDGQASVWASRMRVGAMVPAMADINAAGFDSVELVAPNSQFVRWAKDLGENPWDWVENAVARAGDTQLRLHGGGSTGGTSQAPPIVGDLILKRFADLGVVLTRVGDQWHNVERIGRSVERLTALGYKPIINITYSISPYHTMEFYRERVRAIKSLDPFRVCLKDVGGLLTPETAREMATMMVEELPGIDLEFHGHCGGSFAPICALIAADCGFQFIHTGIPPLANGGAQPSVFTVTENLREKGYGVNIDLDPLRRVSEHLYRVAEYEGLPVGEQVEYHESHYKYQLAGGAAAHLHFQLTQLHLEHLWDEVLDEIVQVRSDLGYPIMITPYVSWIASQATINVATGKRYEVVTDEIIRYAYGYEENDEGVCRMDPAVRQKILDTPRAAELENWRPWTPTFDELIQLFGTADIDELILRCYVGDKALAVLAKERSYPQNYTSYQVRSGSIGDVIRALGKDGKVGHLMVRRGRSTISMRARS